MRLFTLAISAAVLMLVGIYFMKQHHAADLVAHKPLDIQKIMDYPLPHVIARYCKDYKVDPELAKIYEIELKRFFILAGNNNSKEGLGMFSAEVDNLWHTFLLFTKDYQKFCHDLFGRFIHHNPIISTESEESGNLA